MASSDLDTASSSTRKTSYIWTNFSTCDEIVAKRDLVEIKLKLLAIQQI